MFRSKIPIILIILLVLSLTVVISPVCAEHEGAATAISSARDAILDCYHAAKEAEAAGANITAIVAILNEAGLLLSQSELAYVANDFEAAFNLALQSQNALNGFIGEANALKGTALQQQNQDFLINVVGSILGALAVIVVGGLVWLLFVRKYETAEADASESEGI